MTVADSNGDVLNAPGTDAGNVAAGTIEQQQTETYDQSLDDSLQDMLATVLGAGNAVVHASAVLDFDQTQITSQMYDPNKQGPIPVQQATSKETYTGAGASQAAGVQGASNVPVTADHHHDQLAKSARSGSAKTTTTVAAVDGRGGHHRAELHPGRQLPAGRRERGHQVGQLGPGLPPAAVSGRCREQFGQGRERFGDQTACVGGGRAAALPGRQHPGRFCPLRPDRGQVGGRLS